MKRVAVLGCSQSEFDQASGKPWSIYMAEEFDVHVDNWAMQGKGFLWYDFVLKHIVANQIHYDAIIIQETSMGRWFIPIDQDQRLNFDDVIEPRQIYDNYTVMFKRPGNFIDALPGFQSFKLESLNLRNPAEIRPEVKYDPVCYPASYGEYFLKTLHLYEPIFENIFTLSWKFDVLKPLRWHHGIDSYIDDITYPENNDRGHFNPRGTRMVYDHCILTGKIGDWLRSI
jgi:hypothetical protein